MQEEESKDLKLFTRWPGGHEEETNCGEGARTTGSGPPAQMRASKRQAGMDRPLPFIPAPARLGGQMLGR